MTEYEIKHGLSQDAPGPLEPVELAASPVSTVEEHQPARDWELTCHECDGSGFVFVQRQVAERKTDVQEFKEECECCEGRGFTIAFQDIPGIEEYVKACRPAPAAGVSTEADPSFPTGAIVNGRVLADRLEAYPFESQGGDLRLCSDWVEFRRCFEYLAEWIGSRAPAAGDARGATERHTIEGTISFMRSDAESQVCVCCPPKTGHIFSRGVDWDAWETGAPEHFGRGPDVLVRRYATGINANEGKRVRVTVEVLPDDLAAQRKGDA